MAEKTLDPEDQQTGPGYDLLYQKVREDVSGVPVKNIPKEHQLTHEEYLAAVDKFLRRNPDPFGVNEK